MNKINKTQQESKTKLFTTENKNKEKLKVLPEVLSSSNICLAKLLTKLFIDFVLYSRYK